MHLGPGISELYDAYDPKKFGEGYPATLVAGGLNFARSDMEQLANHTDGKFIVPANPFLLGNMELSDAETEDAQWAEELMLLFEAEDCDRILAHSYGTRIALHMALQAQQEGYSPDIILIAPPLKTAKETGLEMSRKIKGKTGHEMCLDDISRTMTPEVREDMLRRHEQEYRVMIDQAMHIAKRVNIETQIDRLIEEIARIRSKITVIIGEHDPYHSPERMNALLRANSAITAHVIEGTSHFPHLEKPEQIARLLAA